MKKTTLALLATTALTMSSVYAQADRSHGGGNGGDDIELDLKKRTLQIAYFVKSSVGTQTFKMLNGDAVIDTVNTMDLDVVDGEVTDKYGTLRTCVNEPERALITCDLKRITELKLNKKEDVLTGLLFHEILGLMGLELGYQENVSLYPVSSKILAYNDIVMQTPIADAQIRPEFYALDGKSYGYTLINKETNESVRLICLNNNVDIHRCRNYSLVRSANGIQAPLIPGVISITPAELAKINLNGIKPQDLIDAEAKLQKIQKKGFKFLTYAWDNRCENYVYGVGAGQGIGRALRIDSWRSDACNEGVELNGLIPPFISAYAFDTVIEVPKQALNIATWPVKGLINGIRALSTSSKIKKMNKTISSARDVLNLNNELNLVGTSKSVKDKDYKIVLETLTRAVRSIK